MQCAKNPRQPCLSGPFLLMRIANAAALGLSQFLLCKIGKSFSTKDFMINCWQKVQSLFFSWILVTPMTFILVAFAIFQDENIVRILRYFWRFLAFLKGSNYPTNFCDKKCSKIIFRELITLHFHNFFIFLARGNQWWLILKENPDNYPLIM